MAEPKGTVWGKNIMVSAAQVRTMYPEALQQAVIMAIEQAEAKARELGIEEPAVMVMFLTEFLHVPEEEETDSP